MCGFTRYTRRFRLRLTASFVRKGETRPLQIDEKSSCYLKAFSILDVQCVTSLLLKVGFSTVISICTLGIKVICVTTVGKPSARKHSLFCTKNDISTTAASNVEPATSLSLPKVIWIAIV
ncbi:hypothetical protein ScPMuIL_008408 [Solemya velum]